MGRAHGDSRKVSPRLYIIVGLLLVALPLLGYGVIRWIARHREWAEECVRQPVQEFEFPEREGVSWVDSVVILPGGKRALSGGEWQDAAGYHAEILLWEIDKGRLVREFEFPERAGMSERWVSSVAVSPDGRRALSGGWWRDAAEVEHAETYLWDLEEGKLVKHLALPKHERMRGRRIDSVAILPGSKLALSGGWWRDTAGRERAELLLWEIDKGQLIRELEFPEREGVRERWVSSVAISPGGRRTLSGGWWADAEGTHAEILLWDLDEGQAVRRFEFPGREGMRERYLRSVAVSPDGRPALSGSLWLDAAEVWHGEILLWDLDKGQPVRELAFPRREGMSGRDVFFVAVSPDGRRALSGGYWKDAESKRHAELLFWDLGKGRLVREFAFSESEKECEVDASSAIFSPDGRFVLSSGWREYAVERDPSELFLWRLPDELGYWLLGTQDESPAE